MSDDQIIDAILRREGGFVDDPTDRGGCTNRGITIETLATWRKHPVSCEDVRLLSEQEAREIYRAMYLTPFDGLSDLIKAQVVDIAVNSGVRRAHVLLADAQQSSKPLPVALVIERLKFYARIVRDDPKQSRFLLGWIQRAVSFL